MKKRGFLICCLIFLLLAACDRTESMTEPTVTPAITTIPSATPTPVPTPFEQKDELEILREKIREEGDLCATAYLGYLEGGYTEFFEFIKEHGLLVKFPFLNKLDEENAVLASGGEWYVVIPAGENISFSVYESSFDEETFMLVPGKELLQTSGGELLLVRGNVSDIFPSVIITATDGSGKKIEFSPSLSLKDGSLNQYDGVYDATPYGEGN